ncbi:TetR family transcriptional regulator C-terminal domain-containing protein [Subsaxibacter sp. CAU 1640]|uniref:TetR family transcriptional regulator C-terminal domain-containing protein n=1 Tax=Subsaxibacter sp. CAU 1640 TaxID=2933271 RepID=UPI00200670F6|nr:TetR family transcriptional regulator C-terminal domain-containing protein [Subsaxibacter sp. CAU 1640]MCK7591249.1 TetR family transcriptional regulator C-terminal domain-containing protein [Subsaxibacter sp. CAU 1640]
MAKKKNITEEYLITSYMNYILEHANQPKTVYAFAKANNFEEALFYKHFGSFEALEKAIFSAFYKNTINILENSEEYQTFDARNKLLSFYFTFFENLTANRSYVLFMLNNYRKGFGNIEQLSGLHQHFKSYIENLGIETLDLKNDIAMKVQSRALQESAWGQFLLTLAFWRDDNSPSFEKTDMFIEKSVHASFDIINVAPIKSVIDFGKFIYKEKMTMKTN